MLTAKEIAERQEGLGASDAGAYCGVSRYKSRLQLMMEKVGEIPISDEETEAQFWGKVFEQPILDRWSEKTGIKIRQAPKRAHADLPYFFVHMDSITLNTPDGPWYVEAKELVHTAIHSLEDLPDEYYLQLQHGLFVTGYQRGAFAIRARGKLVDPDKMIVERDQATIDKMAATGVDFWENHVLKGVYPDIDGSESVRDMLKVLYPKDDGRVLTLDSTDARQTIEALLAARGELDKLEERERALTHWLKWRMADAGTAEIPGWGKILWKTSKDRQVDSLDLKRLREEFPAAYAACFATVTKTGTRPFLLRPAKED